MEDCWGRRAASYIRVDLSDVDGRSGASGYLPQLELLNGAVRDTPEPFRQDSRYPDANKHLGSGCRQQNRGNS